MPHGSLEMSNRLTNVHPPAQSRGGRLERHLRLWPAVRLPVLLSLLLWAGCGGKKESPAQRAEAAKSLFDQATKTFHVPSAQAVGADKVRLQQQAAEAYQELLRVYPEQSYWAAQALRNLAGIRAAQTNLNEAIRLYGAVAEKYPREEFEVVQAWKAAADLLWDADRRGEAAGFYRQIVGRFDGTNQPPVVRLVVKGSKARLAEQDRSLERLERG
jgi:tetratricopeptide (TPR) repeat protein